MNLPFSFFYSTENVSTISLNDWQITRTQHPYMHEPRTYTHTHTHTYKEWFDCVIINMDDFTGEASSSYDIVKYTVYNSPKSYKAIFYELFFSYLVYAMHALVSLLGSVASKSCKNVK